MKISLVRHFKVDYKPSKKWMNSNEFNQWVNVYDESNILVDTDMLDKTFLCDICFSSDLTRAIKTAEMLHSGTIIRSTLLREIDVKSVFQVRMRLHYNIWLLMGRLAWYFSHRSQSETRDQTLLRVRKFIDIIESSKESNILVVSHGALMRFLAKELRKRGYRGRGFLKPGNGESYCFERS
jgi:broad specificity phosphatase PhoE